MPLVNYGSMKKKYTFKYLAFHFILYPLRFITSERLREKIWIKVLKHRNSVPLYLVLKKGDIAVQVGTPNILTVKRFASLVGDIGKVIIIEAHKENISKLKNSADLERYSNITFESIGAWSSEGTVSFAISDDYDGDHKVVQDNVSIDNDDRTSYQIMEEMKVDTLDNILSKNDIKSVNYLSITVNGAEHEVLKGAKQILTNSKDAIIFSKGHSVVDSDDGVKENLNVGIQSYMQDLGYRSIISKGENIHWGETRSGDVFSWRSK